MVKMKNVMTDQADGLRRLMAKSSGRLVVVLSADAALDVAGVTMNLGAALMRQGREVLLLDEYGGAPANQVRPDGRLVLLNARLNPEGGLSPMAAQADHILVTLQPNPDSITRAYACIKRLHQARALQRLRVLVSDATDVVEAQRILVNLAQAADRYLSLALESAGWVRADPLIAQAQRLNLSVVEAFQTSPSATDYCRIAIDMLKWSHSTTKGRKPAPPWGRTAGQAAGLEMANH